MKTKKIICILGPTGIGKSYIGHELAKKMNGEILSCDSIQVYKYFDIGTDKVSKEYQKEVRYHLIDILEPNEGRFSAGTYKRIFEQIVPEVHKTDKTIILVGGTGLYYKAIRIGLFEGPQANKEIRKKLYTIYQKEGTKSLYERLLIIDPEYSKKVSPNDLKRILRALEVYEITKEPFSELHKKTKPSPFEFISFFILTDREKLYENIERRVDTMIERGLVEEVKWLVNKYGKEIYPLSSIGYKEIVNYLESKITLEEAIIQIKKNTRNLAKRQITLFRNTINDYTIELPILSKENLTYTIEKIYSLL